MKKLAIGIDIGGTNVSCGIVTNDGAIISKFSFPIKDFETIESFIVFLSEEIKKILEEYKATAKFTGIGIGAPNGNYYNGSIEYAPNLKWKGVIPLASMLSKETDLPVLLTNDANAAALGEMIYGNAKGVKDFIMVTLGTGLGSGFVANGELILGHDGFAGELGHTIFDPNGRSCNCGRKGCLETYSSASGIVRTVKEMLLNSDEASILRKISLDKISSETIYKAALENDAVAIKAFDYTAYVLGIMLANAVAITSPKVIFLFGGLANAGDILFKPVKTYFEEHLLALYKNKIELKPSGIPENDAAILGAAALVWNSKQ